MYVLLILYAFLNSGCSLRLSRMLSSSETSNKFFPSSWLNTFLWSGFSIGYNNACFTLVLATSHSTLPNLKWLEQYIYIDSNIPHTTWAVSKNLSPCCGSPSFKSACLAKESSKILFAWRLNLLYNWCRLKAYNILFSSFTLVKRITSLLANGAWLGREYGETKPRLPKNGKTGLEFLSSNDAF